MDPTARFADLLQRPEREVPLDEAALLVAAHAYPGLDVDAGLAAIDDLASRCYAPTLDALVRHLFVDLGFAGNEAEYYDPRNSYLNDVTERRIGIPLTLSLLTLEVGRRIGVPLAGVSMPGHFLLRDRVDPDVFVDPFCGGAQLDRSACERAFRAVQGQDAPFDPAYLEPVGAHVILARLLANLKAIFASRRERTSLRWVLELRVQVPGVPPAERRELALLLASEGRFAVAAAHLEALATLVPDAAAAEEATRMATRLRARLN